MGEGEGEEEEEGEHHHQPTNQPAPMFGRRISSPETTISQITNGSLIRFKAGKLYRKGNMLVADSRKGFLSIEKLRQDDTLHFRWNERNSTANAEDDLIIFPEEVEFLPIPQCPKGKAFVLKFKTSPVRLYFWIQDCNLDQYDEKFVKNMNRILLNNSKSPNPPPPPMSTIIPASASAAIEKAIETASRGGKTLQATTTLSKVLSWENVNTILENPKVHQKLFALIPPSLPKTREELESVIQSSQFRQTVSFMDDALKSGELAPLLFELGLDPSIGGPTGGGVEAFLYALKQKEENDANSMNDQ